MSTISFIKPNVLIAKSGFVGLFVVLFLIFVLGTWLYMFSNWDDIKCRNGNFYAAPLFFRDTNEAMQSCFANKIQDAVESTMENNDTRINNIQTNVSSLSNKVKDIDGMSKTLASNTNSKLSNVTNILQKNMDYVKNALSTILSALYISTSMNKGALTSYEDLQKSEISEIIDKYNNIDE